MIAPPPLLAAIGAPSQDAAFHREPAMRRLVLIVGFWLFTGGAPAIAQTGPGELVSGITTTLSAALKTEQAALSSERGLAVANEIILRDVAPHLDFATITREAVGNRWASATAVQRLALEREFRQLLTHVLARLLLTNRDDQLEALPVTLTPGATTALVRVAVTRQRAAGSQPGEPMRITLRLGDGGWKVHEVRSDGVDIFKLYGSNFAVVLERNGEIEGLVRALGERNALNAAAMAPRPRPVITPAD